MAISLLKSNTNALLAEAIPGVTESKTPISAVVIVVVSKVIEVSAVIVPVTSKLSPIYNFLAIPTPPSTIKAPVVELLESVTELTLTVLFNSIDVSPFNCITVELLLPLIFKFPVP